MFDKEVMRACQHGLIKVFGNGMLWVFETGTLMELENGNLRVLWESVSEGDVEGFLELCSESFR